mmetsp:Transcript_111377/g.355386  ORF Transcript_111377/g.355386 Transcript_111377/m.355386 type:complete len:405 (+) Transcript_111377:1194-2408(+)
MRDAQDAAVGPGVRPRLCRPPPGLRRLPGVLRARRGEAAAARWPGSPAAREATAGGSCPRACGLPAPALPSWRPGRRGPREGGGAPRGSSSRHADLVGAAAVAGFGGGARPGSAAGHPESPSGLQQARRHACHSHRGEGGAPRPRRRPRAPARPHRRPHDGAVALGPGPLAPRGGPRPRAGGAAPSVPHEPQRVRDLRGAAEPGVREHGLPPGAADGRHGGRPQAGAGRQAAGVGGGACAEAGPGPRCVEGLGASSRQGHAHGLCRCSDRRHGPHQGPGPGVHGAVVAGCAVGQGSADPGRLPGGDPHGRGPVPRKARVPAPGRGVPGRRLPLRAPPELLVHDGPEADGHGAHAGRRGHVCDRCGARGVPSKPAGRGGQRGDLEISPRAARSRSCGSSRRGGGR